MFRIALIEPKIPQNTGNIARMCASTNIELVLVGKLGFSLEDKYLKRAGMDYWNKVKLSTYIQVEDYFVLNRPFFALSTKGKKLYTEIDYNLPDFDLVFGCESSGLPDFVYQKYSDNLFRIPMDKGFRSLNLSSAAAITAYFVLEKTGFQGLI